MKRKVQILEVFCWPFLVEFISETITDRANQSTHFQTHIAKNQEKKHIKTGQKSSICSPDMQNFGFCTPFRKKIIVAHQ